MAATSSQKPDPNATLSLRTLIDQKRKRGAMQDALLLAKLGRRILLQSDKTFGTDEISRKAFELFLEINPGDSDVLAALQQLPTHFFTPQPIKKNILRAGLLLGAFIFLSITASAVFYHAESFSPKPKALKTSTPIIKPLSTPPTASTSAPSSFARSSALTTSSAAAQVSTPPIIIRAVGDVVLGSTYPHIKLPDETTKKRIEALHQTLNNADLVVGNLEGVLYDKGKSTKDVSRSGYFTFRMPESYANTLHAMGFDVLSMANNHSMDFGVEGMESTTTALRAVGIQPVGVPGAEVATVTIRETKIAFLSYSYLTHFTQMNNEEQIKLDIENAKQLATLVVVTVHAGGEGAAAGGTPEKDEYFMNEYRGNIRKFAQFAIDSGASAVFGHGPHVIRPYEIYRGKPIFFSLGNFIGYRSFSTKGTLGNSIVAEVRFTAQGQFLGAGIIPLKMDEWGIPTADYSLATLNTLDGLLDKQLEKRPVLELSIKTPITTQE